MKTPSTPFPALLVLRKEIREALRDRSLVFNLVLVPLFMYPILGFGAFQVLQIVQGSSEKKELTIHLDREVDVGLRARLQTLPGLRFLDTAEALDHEDRAASLAEFRELRETTASGDAHALLSWWRSPDAPGDSCSILFDSSREDSERARELLAESSLAHRDSMLRIAAGAVGLKDADLDPWDLQEEDLSTARQRGRYILSLLLPLLVVIMLPQGCYYATLDTVVGERERGTLETILSAPLQRRDILLGKFLFVLVSSMTSFLLNLLSIALFIGFALRLLDFGASFAVQLRAEEVLLVLLVALLTACFLAACMMVVAVPAKNYREGQASLMPLYLVPALSGLMVSMSSDSFTIGQACIPMVNVVALLRSVIRGDGAGLPAAVTLLVMAALATVAISVAARISEREEIFFDPNLTLKRLLGRQGRVT